MDIRESVKNVYADAVRESYLPTGIAARSNYGADSAADVQSFGCGNPVQAALLKEGERVLDLGSGAGFDLILAAKAVGKEGHVYGLDMTKAMLDKARKNISRLGVKNITLLRGYIEDMPLHDESVNVLISNCVINLSPEKEKVFSETYRVLVNGGRFCVSDVVLLKKVPDKLRGSPAAWSG